MVKMSKKKIACTGNPPFYTQTPHLNNKQPQAIQLAISELEGVEQLNLVM